MGWAARDAMGGAAGGRRYEPPANAVRRNLDFAYPARQLPRRNLDTLW